MALPGRRAFQGPGGQSSLNAEEAWRANRFEAGPGGPRRGESGSWLRFARIEGAPFGRARAFPGPWVPFRGSRWGNLGRPPGPCLAFWGSGGWDFPRIVPDLGHRGKPQGLGTAATILFTGIARGSPGTKAFGMGPPDSPAGPSGFPEGLRTLGSATGLRSLGLPGRAFRYPRNSPRVSQDRVFLSRIPWGANQGRTRAQGPRFRGHFIGGGLFPLGGTPARRGISPPGWYSGPGIPPGGGEKNKNPGGGSIGFSPQESTKGGEHSYWAPGPPARGFLGGELSRK